MLKSLTSAWTAIALGGLSYSTQGASPVTITPEDVKGDRPVRWISVCGAVNPAAAQPIVDAVGENQVYDFTKLAYERIEDARSEWAPFASILYGADHPGFGLATLASKMVEVESGACRSLTIGQSQ